MSYKFSRFLVNGKFFLLTLVLTQASLLGQIGPGTDDLTTNNLFDFDDFVYASESAVQLVEDIYELDTSASLRVYGDQLGSKITVYLDGNLIGGYNVRGTSIVDVNLPGPAQSGSFLFVYDVNDKLVYSSPVLYRTYHRGNVVESGNYGDNDPDMADVMFLFEHVFLGGPAPAEFEHGDVDYSGAIDLDDVMALMDHINGGSTYQDPRADVLFDGSILVMNNEEPEGPIGPGPTTAPAAARKSTPPRRGQGAVPVCLDGNPRTKEWFWPDCVQCLAGGKKVGLVSWGPRNPDDVPTGSNSCFARYLTCPDGTVKLVGKCVFGDGLNSWEIAGGVIKHTCKNRGNDETFLGITFKECGTVMFKTNIATCDQTICLDPDGDGIMDLELEVDLEL